MKIRSIAAAALLTGFAGCAVSPVPTITDTARSPVDAQQPADIDVLGTVRWIDLEGGFWAIRGDNEVTYDPQGGLPSEFRQDGLRVRLRAREIRDAMSIRMVGPIVEIVQLTRQ